MSKTVYIISAGPGARTCLTHEALEYISRLDKIIAFDRLSQLVDDKLKLQLVSKVSEVVPCIERLILDYSVGILVSGSASFHSITSYLKKSLANTIEIKIVPGISSLDYLRAKISVQKEDCIDISAHGNSLDAYTFNKLLNDKPFLGILCDRDYNPARIASMLCELGYEQAIMYVGENLSYDTEKIYKAPAQKIKDKTFEALSVVIIARDDAWQKQDTIERVCFGKDAKFFKKHPKVPVTKAEVRSVILSKFDFTHAQTMWDVGAGSASVSIEACIIKKDLQAVCFEKNDYACKVIEENIIHFNTTERMQVFQCLAPEGFDTFALPDLVFIGGSGQKLDEILTYLISHASKNIQVVLSALSLDTAQIACSYMSKAPFSALQMQQIAVNRLSALGQTKILKAENPVLVISALLEGKK